MARVIFKARFSAISPDPQKWAKDRDLGSVQPYVRSVLVNTDRGTHQRAEPLGRISRDCGLLARRGCSRDPSHDLLPKPQPILRTPKPSTFRAYPTPRSMWSRC